MAVIKRFHDCLLPTHDKVLETYEKIKHLAVKEGFLRAAAGGYHFYNTSPFTFERLKTDPENIKANFESFINGFSDNVIDILANMGFFNQIDRMNDAGVLYQVISDFCEENADMSPDMSSCSLMRKNTASSSRRLPSGSIANCTETQNNGGAA